MTKGTDTIRYQCTKTYDHDVSVAFRQWRADSHCKFIHGYALKIRVTFEGPLDERNWIVDFGGLKLFKTELEQRYDHKLLIAKDDPHLKVYESLMSIGIADVRTVEHIGIESFAKDILVLAEECLTAIRSSRKVPPETRVVSVEVWEHPGNSAKAIRDVQAS